MREDIATKRADGQRDRGPKASTESLGRTFCRAIITALVLGAAGCVKVGPDFVQPAAPTADQWLEEADPRIKRQEADFTTWWQVFQDPVLDRLIETAYRQNFDLLNAGLRVLEARAQLGIAVGNQYPQTQEAQSSYNRVRNSRNAPNAGDADRKYDDLSVGIDSSWEIDFWGRFQRGIESADSALGASIAEYEDFLVILTADVATTYVTIREFEQRIRLARDNVRIQEESFNLTRERFREGVVTQLDVAEAQSLLEDTRASVPGFEIDKRQAENALATLLGITPIEIRQILTPAGPIPKAPKEVAIGIPADLLRRRPDIRQAELAAATQSARIGIAKADLFPRVSLVGSIGFQTAGSTDSRSNGAKLTDLFDSDSFTFLIGPSIQWAFLNYGRITNNVRVQDARFQQLVASYQDTVLNAYQEVEDGLVGFLKAQEQTEFLARSVAANLKSVELSVLQYREGISPYTRVLTTQQDLFTRQDRQTQAQSQIAQNLIATYRALGGGWELLDANAVVPDDILEEMRERTDWGNILPANDLQEAPSSGEDVERIDTLFRAPDF